MDIPIALLAAAGSFVGSGIAARIVLMMDDALLKRIVIFVLPIAAVIIFLNRGYGEENNSHILSKRKKIFLAGVIGLFIGFYDGMVGPGTGTFAIIAFSILICLVIFSTWYSNFYPLLFQYFFLKDLL